MRRFRHAGRWALTATTAAALCGLQPAAQAAPDVRRGLEIARVICAGCHAVERGNLRSINSDAPAFSVIATWPAMSEIALRAALQSPHRLMPDIVLTREDLDDIIAYILGLKDE